MGLMHRVLDLKTRGTQEYEESPTPGLKASSTIEGEAEEVLVQVLQGIPSLEDGFSGLYQSFHLLRDLLAFDKLVLMGLTSSQELVFEPLINYGFDPSSLTKLRMNFRVHQTRQRYTVAGDNILQKLSARDRELVEDPYYLIYLGLSSPWGVLLGSGPFTRFQYQGTPVFGPVAQILDSHISRFLPKNPGTSQSVLVEQFSKSLTDSTILGILDLEPFSRLFRDSYPDTVFSNFAPLLRGWIEGFLPPNTLFTWTSEVHGGFFIPEIAPIVYDLVIRQLTDYLSRSFLIEIATPLGQAGSLELLIST